MKKRKKENDRMDRFINKFVYVAVILAPVMNIPQLLKIWVNKTAEGVSVISWVGFAVMASIWLAYGIVHKEKPIIIMNIVLIITQVIIAYGAWIY